MPITLKTSPKTLKFIEGMKEGFEVSEEEAADMVNKSHIEELKKEGVEQFTEEELEAQGMKPDPDYGKKKVKEMMDQQKAKQAEMSKRRDQAQQYYDSYFKGTMSEDDTGMEFDEILNEHERNIGQRLPKDLRSDLKERALEERIQGQMSPEQRENYHKTKPMGYDDPYYD